MKKNVMNYCYNLVLKYGNYNEDEKEKLMYGIEGLYLTISKLLIIVILAIAFHIEKDVLLTIVLFKFIRYTGFG